MLLLEIAFGGQSSLSFIPHLPFLALAAEILSFCIT